MNLDDFKRITSRMEEILEKQKALQDKITYGCLRADEISLIYLDKRELQKEYDELKKQLNDDNNDSE